MRDRFPLCKMKAVHASAGCRLTLRLAVMILFSSLLLSGCGPRANSTGGKSGSSGNAVPSNDLASIRQDSTRQYWNGLRTIYKKVNALKFGNPKTSAAVSAELRRYSQAFYNIAEEIGRLKALNVDQEATAYGLQANALFRDTALLYSDFADLVTEMQTFFDNSSSFEAGFEAFVRGFFGDPLGKYNDVRVGGNQLEQRRQKLLMRKGQLEAALNKLNTEESRTRISLSQKYNVEFPTLD